MERNPLPHERIVFVCLNEREAGVCCARGGAEALHARLKEAVKARGLSKQVRISRAGCMDRCGRGPNVMLFPEGVWYSGVSADDVEPLLEDILKGVSAPE